MKNITVANRYARALFIVTEKRRDTTRALEDLKSLLELLAPGSRVGAFLASPQVRLTDKRAVLKRGLEGLVEKAQGVQRAHLASAVPLEPAETQRVSDALERHTRSKIKLTTEVDPALLGGALVRIGDRVIDRSVRTLLESIEKQLREVSV